MTSLNIELCDIPPLHGKTAIITGTSLLELHIHFFEPQISQRPGGSSGIGFASAKLLASKGAKVYSLDLTPPEEQVPDGVEYTRCDVTSWSDLYAVFKRVQQVDITVANAGITETSDFLADTFDSDDQLLEPAYPVLDVNYRSVLNFVKLSVSTFRRQGDGGSIVIVSSATAYSPEHSLPVYGSAKLAVSITYQIFRVQF